MKTTTTLFAIVILFFHGSIHAQDILVISGGGARGAWGGGVAEKLFQQQNKKYTTVIGTSTGSLLAPFIVNKDFATLKETYTNVGQKDIFNVNPFKKDGKVKTLNAFIRLILGKPTLGESKKLRKLIDKKIPIDVYESILDSGNFIVTVVNFATGDIHYFNTNDFDTRSISCQGLTGGELKDCMKEKEDLRAEMLDWVWASGNQPVFMTLMKTKDENNNKHYWVDGGIRENVALIKGLQLLLENDSDQQNDTLDVIINNTKDPQIDSLIKPNVINSLLQTIDIFSYDSRQNDVRVPGDTISNMNDMKMIARMVEKAMPKESGNNVVINLYFMNLSTYKILPKSLLFKKEEMTKLWNLGNNYEESGEIITRTISREYAEYLVEEAF